MGEVKIRLAAGTDVGLVRTNNEDNFIVCSDVATSDWKLPPTGATLSLGAQGALLVVADGMGGANAGEVASAIAVETVREMFSTACLTDVVADDRRVESFMIDAVKTADKRIARRSTEDEATQGMGTTIVMVWVIGLKAHVCWCGDSRCYLFNPNVGLTRLSKDHSYVQQLIDRGELSPELAHHHPYSNVITQCLGDAQRRAEPDYRSQDLHNGDVLMLCSDGLCGLCQDDEIVEVMHDFVADAAVMRDRLIESALSAGGHDNVTVAICAVESDDVSAKSSNKTDSELTRTLPSSPGRSRRFAMRLFLLLLAIILAGAAVLLNAK